MISYEAPAVLAYELLGVDKLDAFEAFLSATISADPIIEKSQLINMLETEHGVIATNRTMAGWRRRRLRLLVIMARQSLAEACDVHDAMIASMGPEVIIIDEIIELAVGAMDSEVVAITADGLIIRVAIDVAIIPDSVVASGGLITFCVIDSGDVITKGFMINRFNKSRPFYGPNIPSMAPT